MKSNGKPKKKRVVNTCKNEVDNNLLGVYQQNVAVSSGRNCLQWNTVRSLAPICSSLTSTIFSEPILRQSHTARQRQINGNKYSVSFLGQS